MSRVVPRGAVLARALVTLGVGVVTGGCGSEAPTGSNGGPGPPPPDFWQATGFTDALGSVESMTIDNLSGSPTMGYIWVGTSQGRVYRSADNGATWTDFSAGLPPVAVTSLAVDYPDYVVASQFDTVFRSPLAAPTWTRKTTGLPDYGTAVLVRGQAYLFAATLDGIYRSTDHADRWFQEGLPLVGVWSIARGPNRLYAGTARNGVHASTDATGTSWVQVHPGTGLFSHALALDVSSFGNSLGTIYLAGAGDGVFRSVDSGINWTRVGARLGPSYRKVIVAGDGEIVVGTDTAGVYRSVDNGNTWTEINSGLPLRTDGNARFYSVRGFARSAGSGSVFVAMREGVFRSSSAVE